MPETFNIVLVCGFSGFRLINRVCVIKLTKAFKIFQKRVDLEPRNGISLRRSHHTRSDFDGCRFFRTIGTLGHGELQSFSPE